jgi:hypothetical protein
MREKKIRCGRLCAKYFKIMNGTYKLGQQLVHKGKFIIGDILFQSPIFTYNSV